MDALPAHAITPSDSRHRAHRISAAAAAVDSDRDLSQLDQLQAEARLQLLASAARVALCTGAES